MKIGEVYAAFAVIFVLLVISNGMEHGERCQTPDRTSGTCIRIKECPSLVKSVTVKPLPESTLDFLKRSQCGFQGLDSLSCCPSNSPLVTTTTPKTTANMEVTEDVSQHRNLGLLKPDICGPISDFRIVNGNRTKLNEMPWMALIAYTVRSGSPYKCGGSIINDRYVLTAAHCVKFLPRGLRPISVRLGEHDLDSEIDCEDDPDGEEGEKKCAPAPQDFRIEEIVVHTNYKGRPNYHNDVALIRLSRPVDFTSDYVRPICLPIGLQEQNHKLNTGKVIVAGWGLTENGTNSRVLLKVAVPVVPHEQCINDYNGISSLSAVSQMCAGGDKDGGDSCTGDSGGPLTYFGNVQGSPRTIQHGIVSVGPQKCGTFRKPGIYARVGYSMNWILDNLKP